MPAPIVLYGNEAQSMRQFGEGIGSLFGMMGRFEGKRQDFERAQQMRRADAEAQAAGLDPQQQHDAVFDAMVNYKPKFAGGLGGVAQRVGSTFSSRDIGNMARTMYAQTTKRTEAEAKAKRDLEQAIAIQEGLVISEPIQEAERREKDEAAQRRISEAEALASSSIIQQAEEDKKDRDVARETAQKLNEQLILLDGKLREAQKIGDIEAENAVKKQIALAEGEFDKAQKLAKLQIDTTEEIDKLKLENQTKLWESAGIDPKVALRITAGVEPRATKEPKKMVTLPDGTLRYASEENIASFPPGTKPASASVTNINLGEGTGITKATRTKLEEKVIGAAEQANDLASLRSQYDPNFGYLINKVPASLYSKADKVKWFKSMIPDKTEEFYQDLLAFNSLAEQMFNAYRHEITGAQAGIPELKFLRKSYPTSDDSPAQFEAKAKIAEDYFRHKASVYKDAVQSDDPLGVLVDGSKLETEAAKRLATDIQSGKYGEEYIDATNAFLKQDRSMASPPVSSTNDQVVPTTLSPEQKAELMRIANQGQ